MKATAVPAKQKIATAGLKIKKTGTPLKGAEKIKKEGKTGKAKKAVPKSEKEMLKEAITGTLQTAFANIKQAVGEKKFNKKVKKATKVLAEGATKKIKE